MRIFMCAGGTAGHLNPALVYAKQLHQEGHEVRFIGSKRLETRLVPQEGFGLYSFNMKRDFLFPIRMVLAFWKSFRLIRRMKPDIVIAFGSYISLPGAFATILARKPLWVHEQNFLPGRANRFLFKFAQKILLSFEYTRSFLNKKEENKSEISGPFVRPEFSTETTISRQGLMVMGGSQGAASINKAVEKNLDELVKKFGRIIWITGDDSIQPNSKKVITFSYTDKVAKLMYESELILSRAGASTIAEILTTKIPAVLVPHPNKETGQLDNAQIAKREYGIEYFNDINAAIAHLLV